MYRSVPREKSHGLPHRRESLPSAVNVESAQTMKPPSRAACDQYSNIQPDLLAPSVPRYIPPHKRAQLNQHLSISHNITNPHSIPTIALHIPYISKLIGLRGYTCT